MTPTIVVILALVALGIVVALTGRSLRIDTKHIKAELSRNGGSTAMDALHKRLDTQDEALAEVHNKVDDLADLTYGVVTRVDAIEGRGPTAA